MASQTAIVHESIADEFLALITAHSPNVAASATAESDGASLRGLFTETSANRVREIVDDALAKGAKVAAGTAEVKGNVVQPLLLSGVTSDMRIYKEEMFAPVFSMLTCAFCLSFPRPKADGSLPDSQTRPRRRPSSLPTTTTTDLPPLSGLGIPPLATASLVASTLEWSTCSSSSPFLSPSSR